MTTPNPRKIWEHVADWTAILASGALAAVVLLPGAGVPGWCAPVVVSVLGVVGALAVRAMTGSGGFAWWTVLLAGWLAGWSAWAEHRGVWHPVVVTAWLLGAVALTVIGALTLLHHYASRPAAIASGPDAAEIARREELAMWDHMWGAIGQEGVQTRKVTDEPGGRVAVIELPRLGHVTINSLEACIPQMEVILKMLPGAISFRRLSHSGELEVRLRERNQLAVAIPLTPLHYATSINKPFAIGVAEDGTIASISLREIHAMLMGTTGSGKSNLINVLTGQMGRMVDTVIWCIDMKGGRVAKPWISPWANDETTDPVFDWVATTREEAALMMDCFLAAITCRMRSGLGGGKIYPDPSMPQIILLVDEMADLFGSGKGPRRGLADARGQLTNMDFIERADEITQKGRSEAATTVWASQRATNSMFGDGDLKSNVNLRIVMGTANQAEARYAMQDNVPAQKLAAAAAAYKGAGVIAHGQDSSMLVKFFHLDHPEEMVDGLPRSLCKDGCIPDCPVRKTAIETGRMRPQLDQMTAESMGEIYAGRWDRARAELKLQQAPARQGASVSTAGFEDIMSGSGMADPDVGVDPRRVRMRELLAMRGTMGASPKLLMIKLTEENMAPAREVLQRWLVQDAELGLCYSHESEWGLWVVGEKPAA